MEISKLDKNPKEKEDFASASLQMRADAFSALLVSLLREFFMSSDVKALMLTSTISRLEEKYSEEEMVAFKNGLAEVVQRFTTKNDFMG